MRGDTQVLIGVGQFTSRGESENPRSPLELLKIAAEPAIGDAGLAGSVLAELDALAAIAFGIGAPSGLSRLSSRPGVRNPLVPDFVS